MVFQKLQFFGIATVLSASLTYGFLNDVSTIKYLAIKEQSSSHTNHCRRYKGSRKNIPIRSSLAAEIGVGIDLGTTNSAIAFLNENNEPRIIEIPNNGRTMKSVVAFDSKYNDNDNDDSINFSYALVGNEAIEWEQQHEENVYRHVKRVIGTSINHITKETKAVVPHLVLADDTDDDYDYDNKNEPSYISPEYISSCILQRLLMVASEHTGNTITRAVIGVPAYFNDAQRDATVRAANACGIEKVKLLREPEAAALAYGVDKDSDEEEELVLVFDLGGGTYDVSVLMVEKGLTEIVCTSGNSQLGGTNFDAKIAQHVSKLVDGCCKTEESTGMILRAAELIRIYLSNNRIAHLALPLTEEGWLELQEQERKYREESRKVQDRLPDEKVRADGISGRPISRIVLVGGATRMPTIGRIISSLTGVVPQRTVDPDEAVALGCAVH
ncbi:HSP70-domain-containing protein, partial [Fragilariopsis cylindrus CCMP1102]